MGSDLGDQNVYTLSTSSRVGDRFDKPPGLPSSPYHLTVRPRPPQSCPVLLLAHQPQSCFHPGRTLRLRRCGGCFSKLRAAVLPQRYRQLLPSPLYQGFQDTFGIGLPLKADLAPVRNRAGVLKAQRHQLPHLGMTGWFPVGELIQPYVPDHQTSSGIPRAVAFIVLVIRPRLPGAVGEDEPVFVMIVRRTPVQLHRLLRACHIVPALLTPRRIETRRERRTVDRKSTRLNSSHL